MIGNNPDLQAMWKIYLFLKFVSHDVSQGERYYIISVKCEVIERKEK